MGVIGSNGRGKQDIPRGDHLFQLIGGPFSASMLIGYISAPGDSVQKSSEDIRTGDDPF